MATEICALKPLFTRIATDEASCKQTDRIFERAVNERNKKIFELLKIEYEDIMEAEKKEQVSEETVSKAVEEPVSVWEQVFRQLGSEINIQVIEFLGWRNHNELLQKQNYELAIKLGRAQEELHAAKKHMQPLIKHVLALHSNSNSLSEPDKKLVQQHRALATVDRSTVLESISELDVAWMNIFKNVYQD